MNRTDKCEPKVLTPRALIFKARPDRANYRGNHCDGYALAIDELRFTPSELLIAPEGATDVPPLLVLTNTIFNLTCAEVGEGPEGSSVTIEAGALQTLFDWRTIPGIKADRLAYLSRQSADHDLESTVLGWMEDTELDEAETVELIRGYKLLQAQAQYVYDFLRQALDALQSAAEAAARALIYCFWYNVEQTAECDDLYPDEPRPSVTDDFTVAAGAFQSTDGQEEANALALAFAQSQLECVWGNAEQTATCVADLGFPDAVAGNNITPSDPYGQIGSATVIAGAVTSSAGAASADAEALALAISLLDCFYVNTPVSFTCDIRYNGGTTETPGPTETALVNLGAANPAIGKKGSSVTIGAGSIISRTSQIDADEMAEVTALALLDCYWENDEVERECPPRVVASSTFTDALEVTELPSETADDQTMLGVYTLDDAPVNGKSAWSKTEDEVVVATIQWDGSAWVISGVTDLSGSDDPPASSPWLDTFLHIRIDVVVVLSADQAQSEALGGPGAFKAVVEAGTFISIASGTSIAPVGSKAQAQEQADLFAEGQLFCIYCNAEVSETCINTYAPGDQTSLDKTRTVDAGVFCGTDALAVQTQAESLAAIPVRNLTSLDDDICHYGNREIRAKCVVEEGFVGKFSTVDEEAPDYAANTELLSDESLDAESVIAANTLIVLDGIYPGYTNVQHYVDSLATVIALSVLDCYWPNPIIRGGSCGPDTIPSKFTGWVRGIFPLDADNPSRGATVFISGGEVPEGILEDEAIGRPHLIPLGFELGVDIVLGFEVGVDTVLASIEEGALCVNAHERCDEGRYESSPGLEGGILRSYESYADVVAQAKYMASSLVVCDTSSTSITQRPTPVHDFPFLLSITRKTTIGGCPTIVESFNLNLSNIGVNGTGAPTLDTILALDAGTHTVHVDWKFAPFAGSCFTDEVFDSALHGFEGEALVGLNIRVNGTAPAGYSDSVDVYTVTTIDDGGDRVVESSERLVMSLDMKPPPTLTTDFRIYRTDMSLIEFTYAEIIANYDPATDTNWSAEFSVSGSALNAYAESGTPAVMTNPVGTNALETVASKKELFDGDASADPVEAQTYYRLPIIRGGKVVCQGGVYRENIMCAGSRGYIVELI